MNTITLRPLTRPRYDNAHLGSREQWLADNAAELSRYYHELCACLSDDECAESRDAVALVQWDIERWVR